MTLLSYQAFKAVSDMGSFQKAAERLGLTPSAVSHAISSMEAELGFALLNRSRSGITMTNYGEHLLPYVNAILNAEESFRQVVDQMNGLKTGSVKVGVFSSVCTNWIPDLLKDFRSRYADIAIDIYQGTYEEVYHWIKNGVVDLGFLSVSSAGDIPIVPLYRDPLVCVMAKGVKDPEKPDFVDLEEMMKHQFVTQREGTDADIQNFLRENGLRIQSHYHVVDDLSTVRLVEQGMGICLMPELVMRDIPYQVEVYPTRPAAARVIGIAAVKADLMSPAARTLYRMIIDRLSTPSRDS